MTNLMNADWYRVRHGAALRNTFLSFLVVVIFFAVFTAFSTSDESAGFLAITTDPPIQSDVIGQGGSAASGASFSEQMQRSFFIPFFFLPIVLAVFCADFSAGTYRNILSYESKRGRVYLSKLLLSIVLCVGMIVASQAFSILLGGVLFGFTGFTAAFFSRTLLVFALQLPICIGFISVSHFLVAITKKSSTTITAFIVGYLAVVVLLQSVSMDFPSVMMMEPQTGGQIMAMYEAATLSEIITILLYHAAISLIAVVAGLLHYRKVDMP